MADIIDTAEYLSDFKQHYLEPIRKRHKLYIQAVSLTKDEQLKATDIEAKCIFLEKFVSCVEATIEENYVLKKQISILNN